MKKLILATIRPLIAILCLGTASAQSVTYILDYEGIVGSTLIEGYTGKIEVLSYSQAVGRAISAPSSDPREASAPEVGELSVLLALDLKAATELIKAAHVGQFKTVKLIGLRSGAESLEKFMEIEMTATLISGLSQEGSNGNQVYVNLSLNFDKIKYTTIPIDPQTGEPGTASSFTYDLATQTGS